MGRFAQVDAIIDPSHTRIQSACDRHANALAHMEDFRQHACAELAADGLARCHTWFAAQNDTIAHAADLSSLGSTDVLAPDIAPGAADGLDGWKLG